MATAMRSGSGVFREDVAALNLDNPRAAVAALRAAGWRAGTPATQGARSSPVLTVPQLPDWVDHLLPPQQAGRTWVGDWAAQVLNAAPVAGLSTPARLAALALAAHCSASRVGVVPLGLPGPCRAALPELAESGFGVELPKYRWLLNVDFAHLVGQRPRTWKEKAAGRKAQRDRKKAKLRGFRYDSDAWKVWRDSASPALQRHIHAVESCPLCLYPRALVAEGFMPTPPRPCTEDTEAAHCRWASDHPDAGRTAAEATVVFRARHGHGPSYSQLCQAVGWQVRRPMRQRIVVGLLEEGWLTETAPVPWTLRPGPLAQSHGVVLPPSRTPAQAGRARFTDAVPSPAG
ncbi:hypothetical protein ABT093_36830 [Kitasatospora sp. NPDC002551]|uniref:hypothetical protein n=1 Tax=Kitasatospora sp. NPDC002551 TaxID=3154539 RepID=UPI0033261FAB